MTLAPIIATELQLDGISHGFFTREGGHSTGIFSSLNCGLGSGDDLALVKQNRAMVAAQLGVRPDHLISGYQEHGTHVAVVTGPMVDRPKADGLVSNTPGVALGILTADCGPILFADPEAKVIGACHAGWKGALAGVFATTVAAMEGLGAKRSRIVTVLGPTISQAAYEVGPEFPKPFLGREAGHSKFFIPTVRNGHYMFNLPAFLLEQMAGLELAKVVGLNLCTYADEERFFCYRRTTHRGEADYGRLISAIALEEK
ncbi:MAG: peptidoglycan editing factor PgeF [Pseudomonadota bacterium]|nr:peptidoglycan editing factor PgeF [Pseudomonadota bacterium]